MAYRKRACSGNNPLGWPGDQGLISGAALGGACTRGTASERRLSTATVNRALALLRHLLRLAHEEWEVLDVVPR
jgi:hypothetical protein